MQFVEQKVKETVILQSLIIILNDYYSEYIM